MLETEGYEKEESGFVPFESLKPEGMTRIMTSKHNRPSQASPGFPELWYEDKDLKNVQEAIIKGAPVNQRHPISPLRYAVYEENIPLIEMLLQAGALPKNTDMSGNSALSTAEELLRQNPGNVKMQIIKRLLTTPVKAKAHI